MLRDIDRDAFRIDSANHPVTYLEPLLAEAATTFGIELVSILATADLNVSKSELYNQHGAMLGEDWLKLDSYQLQELRDSSLQINAYESCYLTEQSIQAETTAINQRYLETYEWESLPKLDEPAGYVYLLQDVDVTGFYKIGYTNNPERRLNKFGVELPFKTQVVDIIRTDDARLLERTLHRRYADKRRKGEWFDLTASEVTEIRNLDIGISAESNYATASYYSGHSDSANQYAPRADATYRFGEQRTDIYEEDLSDSYGEQLSYSYQAEPWQVSKAEKKKLTWKTGCLYLFLFSVAVNLLGGLDLGSPLTGPSSSARQNRPAVRATVSTANRAAVTTANRTSIAISYVKTSDNSPANVRECPRTTANCTVIARLLPGEAIRQAERVSGEKIGGNEHWVKFRLNGKTAYIHSSVLSSSRMVTPTYYVNTLNNKSAAVRSCPRRTVDCAVIVGLLPGDVVQPQEAVAGESVNGNVIWFKFNHNGRIAYIHSSLVTASE